MTKTAELEFEQVVEATVIEPETEKEKTQPSTQLQVLATPGSLVENFDAFKAQVLAIVEGYDGLSLAEVDIKTMKAARATLNAQAKFLNDSRLQAERIYMAPFDEFKRRANELKGILTDAADRLKVQIDEAEEWARNDRRNLYRGFYEDLAPILVPVVPFERILEDSWLNKTYKGNPEQEIKEKVERIAEGWESLKKLGLENHEQAEVVYFRTLDLAAAITENDRIVAETERIARMRAEREENLRAADAIREPVETPMPAPVATTPPPSTPARTVANPATDENYILTVDGTVTVDDLDEARKIARELDALGLNVKIRRA